MIRVSHHAVLLLLTALFFIDTDALAQSDSADAFTRYELLEPDGASFRIIYDVTAVTAGAQFYFNPIRKGSEARDESVLDLATGKPLRFEVVSGEQARADGAASADLETSYIKVYLLHPVPEHGEVRIRIDKTYRDPKSYFREGESIVFDRPLGIKKNTVVLPKGFELTSSNVPSQVIEEADRRIAVSFINPYPVAAPLILRGKPLPERPRSVVAAGERAYATPKAFVAGAPVPTLADVMSFSERARETTEIVYFLNPPETHSFRLYHDYTESKPGVDRYVNVVRAGSTVSDPSARSLDSGESLDTRILQTDAAKNAGLLDDDAAPGTEVVLIRFPAVEKGASARIRIEETYTDPGRYGLFGETLAWRRSFGRAYNDMVLPDGWYLTASSIPTSVSLETDGRIRLSFVNPRPDSIEVLVRARRR